MAKFLWNFIEHIEKEQKIWIDNGKCSGDMGYAEMRYLAKKITKELQN